MESISGKMIALKTEFTVVLGVLRFPFFIGELGGR